MILVYVSYVMALFVFVVASSLILDVFMKEHLFSLPVVYM